MFPAPRFVAFAWRYRGRIPFSLSAARDATPPSLELVARYLRPGSTTETTGSPKFLGNLTCPSAHALRLRRDCPSQTIRDRRAALGRGTAKAPARNRLSKLNTMAFGLAVYASQRRLPGRHARLASRCWSSSPGRAFHPQGSAERFPKCTPYILSSGLDRNLANW